jgi:hypothetical protein
MSSAGSVGVLLSSSSLRRAKQFFSITSISWHCLRRSSRCWSIKLLILPDIPCSFFSLLEEDMVKGISVRKSLLRRRGVFTQLRRANEVD